MSVRTRIGIGEDPPIDRLVEVARLLAVGVIRHRGQQRRLGNPPSAPPTGLALCAAFGPDRSTGQLAREPENGERS